MSGEIEVDESYFWGHRKGKRGRGAAGKVPVFGLLKRAGKVHAVMIADVRSETLVGLIRSHLRPDSVIDTDAYRSYYVLDVSEFRYRRINHADRFAEHRNHINGIKNFWNQAKRHLRRYNGIPRAHFHLFLDECEWRFNYRPASRLMRTLRPWIDLDAGGGCGAVQYSNRWIRGHIEVETLRAARLATYPHTRRLSHYCAFT